MTSDPTNPFPGNIKGPRPGVPVEPFDYPLPADLAERIGSEKPTVHLIIGPNGKCACGTDCKTCAEFVSLLLLGKSMPDPTNPEPQCICLGMSGMDSHIAPDCPVHGFLPNRERETKTPETDEDWTRAEGLKDSTRALVMRNRARKLELSRDAARAEAEQLRAEVALLQRQNIILVDSNNQLRERCARLEQAGDQLAESLQIRAVFHPAIQEWGEAKRTALNQPKP